MPKAARDMPKNRDPTLPPVIVQGYREHKREMACLLCKSNCRKADDAYPLRHPVRDTLVGRRPSNIRPESAFDE